MPGSTTPTLATSSAPTRSGSRVGEMSMHTRRTTRRHSVIVPGWMTPNPSQCQANTFRSSIPACSPPALTFLPGATDHLDGHSDTTEPTKFQALFLCPYQTLRRKTLPANRLPAWTPIAGRGIVHPQIVEESVSSVRRRRNQRTAFYLNYLILTSRRRKIRQKKYW